MSGSFVLIHLAGAVALLLWATRMVRTGVERAYGNALRRRLRGTLRNPLAAVSAGAGLAIAFQSSTAVSLLVGSFVGSGIVGAGAGLAGVLGADLGSALVVKLLSFDLSILVPVLIALGTGIFLATERRAWRQFGRILVGMGLLLLSLTLIGSASEPLRESRIMPLFINYLSSDPVTAFLIAAMMTWLFHSSVAFILLVAALAARGVLPPELGVVMVLGANLGGALIAALLSRTMVPAGRTVPLGNLLLRGAGSLFALSAFVWLSPSLDILGTGGPMQIVHAHIAFNLAVVILSLPLTGLVTRWIDRMSAQVPAAAQIGENEMAALDPGALSTPARALGNVTRAVLGMCETVETMLREIILLYDEPVRSRMEALAALDDRVDRRHTAIKLYLTKILPEGMSEREERRTWELLGACVKLEQVGDIIVRNMLAHVAKKLDRGLTFTPEGWRELADLHARVLANAHLAFDVIVRRDPATAFELVRQKDQLRDFERSTSHRHFERLREGARKSLETSTLHLDTIRDLKQINSLLAAIASPVLEEHGMLRGSRLMTDTAAAEAR